VSVEMISSWIEAHKEDSRYYKSGSGKGEWILEIDGAKLLEDLISNLSATRYSYNKVEHGTILTNWILDNSPEEFREIANLIDPFLTSP
jgi:hypothetical protein